MNITENLYTPWNGKNYYYRPQIFSESIRSNVSLYFLTLCKIERLAICEIFKCNRDKFQMKSKSNLMDLNK